MLSSAKISLVVLNTAFSLHSNSNSNTTHSFLPSPIFPTSASCTHHSHFMNIIERAHVIVLVPAFNTIHHAESGCRSIRYILAIYSPAARGVFGDLKCVPGKLNAYSKSEYVLLSRRICCQPRFTVSITTPPSHFDSKNPQSKT